MRLMENKMSKTLIAHKFLDKQISKVFHKFSLSHVDCFTIQLDGDVPIAIYLSKLDLEAMLDCCTYIEEKNEEVKQCDDVISIKSVVTRIENGFLVEENGKQRYFESLVSYFHSRVVEDLRNQDIFHSEFEACGHEYDVEFKMRSRK